jgi:DNA-binding NarL/FixJ family response regulator
LEVVGEAADGPEAIEKTDRLRPDVVVMDVTLGEMSGVEATRLIVQRHPDTKIVGLSMHEDKTVADAMLAAGACAYRTKSRPSEELIAAVKQCAPAIRPSEV